MNEDKLDEIKSHLGAASRVIRDLISDELKAQIPAAEQQEEKAAGAAHEAWKAWQAAIARLQETDDELALVREQRAKIEQAVTDADPRTRVEAKSALIAWDKELGDLGKVRAEQQAHLDAVQGLRNQALAQLELATTYREGLEANSDPLFSYTGLGKTTDAYHALRWLTGLEIVLMPGNEDHPERDEAIACLEQLCLWSGYRTDRLPKDTDAYRKHWDDILAQANPPEPAPSGAQVMADDKAAAERGAMALRNRRS